MALGSLSQNCSCIFVGLAPFWNNATDVVDAHSLLYPQDEIDRLRAFSMDGGKSRMPPTQQPHVYVSYGMVLGPLLCRQGA